MKPISSDKHSSARPRLFSAMLAITILLGALEGIYGRVRYSGDAINYLNIVRSIHGGDWRLALNSYWGFGYPFLLAVVTPLFPATPSGEWVAIHVVNLAILIAAFFAFFALVRTIAGVSSSAEITPSAKANATLLVGAFAIFLSIELSMDNVSRVGPDMLVTCLLFLAARYLLRLQRRPEVTSALALGVVLGVGYIVKAIFLPLIVVFALTLVLATWKKSGGLRSIALMLIASAVFAVPYIAGMSWAAGHFTYGDAGPLNYAWNVNKLEPGGLWQGGNPIYGKPIHPAQMVLERPHVYLFDEPFPVTFAPFYNPPYYYQGYRHFFSLRAQAREAAGNLLRLIRILHVQFVIYALLLCWLLSKLDKGSKSQILKDYRKLWPLLAISFSGTMMYLLVFVEARYISSFLAMLLVIPLLSIAREDSGTTPGKPFLQQKAVFLAILLVSCAATLLVNQRDADRDVLGHALHHHLFNSDDQFVTATYLRQIGALPGDKVAIFGDLVSASRSSWAYYDRLRIVGILGGSLLESQTMDFDAFWQASPAEQSRILETFHSIGVRYVLALAKPAGAVAQGWQTVPGTAFWVYRF